MDSVLQPHWAGVAVERIDQSGSVVVMDLGARRADLRGHLHRVGMGNVARFVPEWVLVVLIIQAA
jgi:hypothetical protein